jgi:hypothetical protein
MLPVPRNGQIAAQRDRLAVLDSHDPAAGVGAIERAGATDLTAAGRKRHLHS